MTWVEEVLGSEWPVIGVVHVPPLPGSPEGDSGGLPGLLERVRRDAAALAAGGADAALVENYGDAPYLPADVPKHTVAFMTRIALAAREASGLPVGVNVLRNDGEAALAAAAAAGGSFVRVNVYTGARVTDQGVVQGRAHSVQRLRRRVARGVRVLADVRVKHSAPLGGERRFGREVEDVVQRGGADGVVVTGDSTGRPPEEARLREASRAAGGAPVFAGSGITPEAARTLGEADGVIVGTALKEGGRTRAPVSEERVRTFVEACRGAAGRSGT